MTAASHRVYLLAHVAEALAWAEVRAAHPHPADRRRAWLRINREWAGAAVYTAGRLLPVKGVG